RFIQLLSQACSFTFVSTAYAPAGDEDLYYGQTSNVVISGAPNNSGLTDGMFDLTNSVVEWTNEVTNTNSSAAVVENQPIVFWSPTDNMTLGDGTLKMTLT